MHIQLHMHVFIEENPKCNSKTIHYLSQCVNVWLMVQLALWPFTSEQVGFLFFYLF